MNPRSDQLELMTTPIATSETPRLRSKQSWLISMGNWRTSELAIESSFATSGHPVLWRDGDGAFNELCVSLRRAGDVQIRDMVNQRAIRGDAPAQNLAFRWLITKAKNEAEPPYPPEPEYEPMTQQEAGAYIAAGLRAAGIETPDGLSEEVYTKEQWAKWGR